MSDKSVPCEADDPIDLQEEHKHQCPCGQVFKHSNEMAGDAAAHTCPSCSKLLPSPWVKYRTPAEERELKRIERQAIRELEELLGMRVRFS